MNFSIAFLQCRQHHPLVWGISVGEPAHVTPQKQLLRLRIHEGHPWVPLRGMRTVIDKCRETGCARTCGVTQGPPIHPGAAGAGQAASLRRAGQSACHPWASGAVGPQSQEGSKCPERKEPVSCLPWPQTSRRLSSTCPRLDSHGDGKSLFSLYW